MFKRLVLDRLHAANIEIGRGKDIEIHDESALLRIALQGPTGFFDSYIEGQWDSGCIDSVVERLLSSGMYNPAVRYLYDFVHTAKRQLCNLQKGDGAREGIVHYNDDPRLFEAFLDDGWRQYVSADFSETEDLNIAQQHRLKRICETLGVRDGMSILDIGGGWGGFAKYVAERFDVKVDIITPAREQVEYAKRLCRDLNVNTHCCSYEDIPRLFPSREYDVVTAFEMICHVGHKNVPELMAVVDYSLAPQGQFCLQFIYNPGWWVMSNPAIRKHFYPNYEISPLAYTDSCARKFFWPVLFRNMNNHYPSTLHAWDRRIDGAIKDGRVMIVDKEQPSILEVPQLTIQRRRAYHIKFMSCAGYFDARHIGVGQSFYEKKK